MRWDERFARLVSDLLCPPVTITLGLIMVVLSSNDPTAWWWALITIGITIVIPVLYIAWKVHTGAISDFHIPIRSQRIRPMLLTVACALLTWGILWLGHAPSLLLSLITFGLIQAVIMLFVTLYWKISGHSAAIAGFSLLAIRLWGHNLWPVLLLIPLVAWARVRIRRHTLAQTIAGTLMGISYISLAFL
jgi:membrane-associated phospholipid phosphatase